MKVVAFNGSPRKKGNTFAAMSLVLEEISKQGIETEIVQVGGMKINPCKACGKCRQKKDGFCYGYENDSEDILNGCIKKMIEADGIIIGSPVYFGSLTPETKALIDRSGYSARGAGNTMLRRKVCAPIAVVRRQGAAAVLEQITSLFALSEAIVPYSTYWNMSICREIDELANDEEGVNTFRRLGENMAWLLHKINS